MLTGCDTTSAIFGFEKQSVFKLINSSSAELSDLSQLKDLDLESSICVARKVVAKVDPCSACVDSNGHKELTHQCLNN
jgi:hypothetical protein